LLSQNLRVIHFERKQNLYLINLLVVINLLNINFAFAQSELP
jgi:hypothetical protein